VATVGEYPDGSSVRDWPGPHPDGRDAGCGAAQETTHTAGEKERGGRYLEGALCLLGEPPLRSLMSRALRP
jgi:hypothetical protein